jgi:hypothetical protein
MIRTKDRVFVFVCCCAALLAAGTVIITGCDNSKTPAPTSQASGGGAYFKTPFQDESQFIVETILTDVAEMAFYAKNHAAPGLNSVFVTASETPESKVGAPVYDISVAVKAGGRARFTLAVSGGIWCAETYSAATRSIFENAGLPAGQSTSGQDDGSLLAELTDATSWTIEESNQSLSKALQADFQNPALHEEAAALLGAFALRENSGKFCDVRFPLCRMTAHLAFANTLKSGTESGISGQMAAAMLDCCMNREKAAIDKLEKIVSDNPKIAAWKRSIKAITTGDYRPLAELRNPTPIERIAWFETRCGAVNVEDAWAQLSTNEFRYPDFCRIASSERASVEVGHYLLALQLPGEFSDLGKVYELSHGKKLTRKAVAEELNVMPSRCVSSENNQAVVKVIGWGEWAMFYQRQICHAVTSDFNFMEYSWGVPKEAREFALTYESMLGGLRLYPFVRRFTCTNEVSYRKAIDDSFAVTVASPQLVSPCVWNYLCYKVSFAPYYHPNPNPHINEWHKHNPLPGTAYDLQARFNHPSFTESPDYLARLESLRTLAPYDVTISFNLARQRYGTNLTLENLQSLYALVLDYAPFTLTDCAATVTNQPDKYESLISKAAQLDPEFNFRLFDYFARRTNDAKAISYWETGAKTCRDSVSIANRSLWPVKYYLRTGNQRRAGEIADQAAETYSERGLETKAHYLEETKDLLGALEIHKEIEERYESSGPLIAFCQRHNKKTDDPRFREEVNRRVKKIFPDGMKKVAMKDFTAPPRDGVVFEKASDLLLNSGLRAGDVIVAIEGTEVHNLTQFYQIRDSDISAPMTLIVWQSDKYLEVKASPPERRFGVSIANYKPK